MAVVSLIENGGTTRNIDELSEPELYDLIVDYLRSEKLGATEDEGMSQLLFLEDMLSDLLATEVGASGSSQTVPKTGPVTGDSTSHQEQCPTQPPPDHHRSDRQPTTPITDTSTQPLQMNRHILTTHLHFCIDQATHQLWRPGTEG